MSPRTLSRRQAGFTLIELLVVIAIIGILVALTTAAVQKVRDTGKRAIVVTEIGQLTTSLEAFKQRMNLPEVASRGNGPTAAPAVIGTFVLRSNYGIGDGSATDFTNTYEYKFLKQLFPAAELGGATGFSNGLPDGVQLEQSHLITFWLGGYYADFTNVNAPVQVFGQGFNADSRYPFKSVGTPAAKKGPFFDFPVGRLLVGRKTTAGLCPEYLDPWGTPYVFFSTEGSRPNNYALTPFAWNNGSTTSYAAPLIVKMVSPTNYQFANQKTFQIFSAGKDKTFPFAAVPTVAQLLWTPGANTFVENLQGGDDFSNFNPTIMSVQP